MSEFEVQYGSSYRENDQIWLFRNRVVLVDDYRTASPAEVVLAVKHVVLSQEQAFEDMQAEIERFLRFEEAGVARRERISREVQIFVWRRDQGRCVQCGSNQRLEFDHIIPVALGGGNTERNIQLLCEDCNRTKGGTIG